MRIIAGKHRGRVLAAVKGEGVRPTSDRVKESLFQILTPRLAGASVLDLFCGSGALGLEARSRGAGEICFNDLSEESIALAKKNAAALKEIAQFSRLDFRLFLERTEKKFDLIFCDPPYAQDVLSDVLNLIAAHDLLNAGGLVVYESEREEIAPHLWKIADLRRYGRTKIFMFERREE